LGSESETCVGSRVHLVGVSIFFKKNFYRLPFTPPPLSGSPYRSFKDELALLTRRFERLHENRVNRRRNTRTCFQCGKPGHFVADCPEKGQEQGRLQAQVKDGWQVLVEA
jgi:hypothetical protein